MLNLKTERGRELLLELSRTADVLVENFAPAVMPRLGLGPEVFSRVNPRLIYASGSGFGRTGPYADKRALDLTIQAMSGLMSTTGEKGGRPLKAGAPVADFMSGAHLYGAIVTALYERERTGRGRVVEVSMLESLFATLLPAAGHAYESNAAPQRTGNRHVADSYVPFDTFEAADGWVTIVCATDEHWVKLPRRWSVPISRGRVAPSSARTHRADRRRDGGDREVDGDAHPRRDSATVRKHHVPAAPLRDVMEVLADPHLRARGFLTEQVTERGSRGVAEQSDALRGIGPAAADARAGSRRAHRRGAERAVWSRRRRAGRPAPRRSDRRAGRGR